MLNNNRTIEIIYIPVSKLYLDSYNPRLAGEKEDATQEEIIGRIYENEELEELAGSLALHGFLPEEPIIVIPKQEDVFDQIKKSNIDSFDFIVVEGNRRISSVKLLTDEVLRNNLDIDEDFPELIDPQVLENLQTIPAIIYRERKNVDAYLGIRHIAGNRKWDAYAKAKYIFDKVEECRKSQNISVIDAIDQIKRQISDRKDTIRKLYVYYRIFHIIDSDIVNYQSKHIKDRFSLIQVALGTGRTTISEYIGVPPFSQIDFDEEIIKNKNIDNLADITKWIFGLKENDPGRVISDSRNISSMLAAVLGNKDSTDHLKRYGNLAGAYELTGGEEDLVKNSLNKAFKAISQTVHLVDKYKDVPEVQSSIEDLDRILKNVKLLIASN